MFRTVIKPNLDILNTLFFSKKDQISKTLASKIVLVTDMANHNPAIYIEMVFDINVRVILSVEAVSNTA